ncbi:MAG: LysR family transcriptional regulator [Betaproteobacteria bacterium]|jgi:LysR family transcriptional regulator, low CO2-responsive transcriptional regulator|nr:LysR family transcriptional regulator [Betaproteobacteria bacterium]NBP44533.1 LysR family transcriptional regulator [Betaproteobacteria bacterium]
MNITFRQLKVFLALAETGSVSAAARMMHVTQPTASMQLKEITQATGVALYEVVGRKIYLTEAGRQLAQTARSMTQQWQAFEQELDLIKGLNRGQLKVSVVSTAQYFMPKLVGAFCKKYPDIDVALEILNRDRVVERLRDNMDDLYIMSMPPQDIELMDDPLITNPIVVIAATADAMARQAKLTLSDLKARSFILREQGSGTRMAVDQFFQRFRFKPHVRLELGSNEAVKEAVAAGLGLGVISSHALHGHERENGVRVMAVKGFPIPSVWHVVHPKAKNLSPIAQAFKQHLLRSASVGAPSG